MCRLQEEFNTDVASAFWDSLRTEEDFPAIPSMPEFNDSIGMEGLANACSKYPYLNDRFLQTLDAGDKQEWQEKIRMA